MITMLLFTLPIADMSDRRSAECSNDLHLLTSGSCDFSSARYDILSIDIGIASLCLLYFDN